MKRMIAWLMIGLILVMPGAAESKLPAGLEEIEAPGALLMAGDGTVLFEKNAREKREPASVTKIMTLLLVMEALDAGTVRLEDVVTASDYACSLGGSQIWMRQGEQFTVEELIRCVAVASANDCAVLLGEHLAGTESAFVDRMNRRARELGMEDTHFVNCCGLPAAGHLTTAYDIALMSRELLKHEKIFDYTTLWMDTIRNGAFGLTNTNRLIKTYPGINGLKTGYTGAAGYCISATAAREGLQLIAVVMGESSSPRRNAQAAALLDYGFANYRMVEVIPEQPVLPVPVELGQKSRVLCAPDCGAPILMPRGPEAQLIQRLEIKESLTAPVLPGTEAGELVVLEGDREIARFPVRTQEEVPALTVSFCFGNLVKMLTSGL